MNAQLIQLGSYLYPTTLFGGVRKHLRRFLFYVFFSNASIIKKYIFVLVRELFCLCEYIIILQQHNRGDTNDNNEKTRKSFSRNFS